MNVFNMSTSTPQTSGQGPVVSGNTGFRAINAKPTPPPKAKAPAAKHRCGIGRCPFETETLKGVHEHQKNKHLGTECFWWLPNGEFCGVMTETHEQLYEHFTKDHLKKETRRNGQLFKCCWPGFPGMPLPTGPPIDPENKCEQTFQSASGAERHAREHQHKIWRRVENVVEPRG
ncbi:hypothetical protein F5Y10DRAFT_265738 [Nemania abortiva]|nr:hypothetical protein F5Y10DRAFT_265738 [Nemania abortiva]